MGDSAHTQIQDMEDFVFRRNPVSPSSRRSISENQQEADRWPKTNLSCDLLCDRCVRHGQLNRVEKMDGSQRAQSLGKLMTHVINEVYVFDTETYCFLYANHSACENLGYTLQEIKQMTPLDLKRAMSPLEFDKLIKPLKCGNTKSVVFKTVHYRKDGTIYSVRAHVQLDQFGDEAVLVAVMMDLTELEMKEEELLETNSELEKIIQQRTKSLRRNAKERRLFELEARNNEQFLRAIMNTAVDGIVTVDHRGMILSFNPAAERIFGYLEREVIGQNFGILMPESLRSNHDASLAQFMETGIERILGRRQEIKARHRDGHHIPIYLAVSKVELSSEIFFTGIIRDISGDKKIEMALKRAAEAANTANRAKSEFLSRMSHELRTPLNVIIGYGELMEEDKEQPLNPTKLEYVRHILNSGSILLNLINEVLDLTKVESGCIPVSMEVLYPIEVVADCLELSQSLAAKHNIRLSECLEDSSKEVRIKADFTRLRQVLMNLITNAIKYNRPDGLVTLYTDRTTENRFRISIVDTGVGIAESERADLFSPFHRLGRDQDAIEGTGIGLTISKKLVELMEGKIDFSSREGEGSTFWVEFPMYTDAERDHDETVPEGKADRPITSEDLGRTAKVLYIEDNPSNLCLMESYFEQLPGMSLLTATDGSEGWHLIKREKPDLIFLDINLPDMSGFEVLKKLRERTDTKSIPAIGVSANAMAEQINNALRQGFSRYLTKPISLAEVMSVIRELIIPEDNRDGENDA